MDTAALARQLAELSRSHEYGARSKLRMAMQENLPAILRALCVMAAVDEGVDELLNMHINGRADELLAECTGAKHD